MTPKFVILKVKHRYVISGWQQAKFTKTGTVKELLPPNGTILYCGEDWLKSQKNMSRKALNFISKEESEPDPGMTRTEIKDIQQRSLEIICSFWVYAWTKAVLLQKQISPQNLPSRNLVI